MSSNVLVVTPVLREPEGRARLYTRALASIFNLQWPGRVDHYFQNGGDDYSDPSRTVSHKYMDARAVFLAGTWEYMMCAEYDMIIPPDAMLKLAALGVDVAYGLYVFRHTFKNGKRAWNAYIDMTYPWGDSISNYPEDARKAWGQAIPVKGVGMGCTLIRRAAIEAVAFRDNAGTSCDWPFAIEAEEAGLSQVCDLSTQCGHMTIVPSPMIFWPDLNEPDLYRTETPQ